ncbi:uncharacterized protein F4807DRAFT_375673 [Annulohypoxylon truncatum]|uniref:uncharacterized protein n=1 Tax=Annulohypoxylon truncatum TaxID=327061 RepID=UPI002007A669|nr:uncharacterized protein F4807DRAFT_375673 [Annulohypoxylon truncatum]KAI1204084.1 hypothetical protein F4807DRAFT_375673 [Annulohypoxylon truncatum]
MADARALLRAHRAEHRIKHPHAAYSDAGKLLCKLCHEPVKAESLWENHIRGPNHRKRAQLQNSPQSQPQSQTTSTTDRSSNNGTGTGTEIGAGVGSGKRKLDEVDEGQSSASDSASEDAIRRKRSRASVGEKRQTPPVLGRRASNAPVQGVEIAIPSRPATPAAGSNSATSTPKGAPVGRSPLIGGSAEAQTGGTPMSISTPTSTPSTSAQNNNNNGNGNGNLPISTQSLASQSATATANPTTNNNHNNDSTSQATSNAVDEAEWAAFEAEIATASEAPGTNGNDPYNSATISAPALSAAQLAAKSEEEENERRKHQLDAQMADEREDATLALEAEFAEMEELESRVRRLKQRREELRKGSVANLRATATTTTTGGGGGGGGDDSDISMTKSPAGGKENESTGVIEEEDDEDEEDEDEDEDDWDVFRFR